MEANVANFINADLVATGLSPLKPEHLRCTLLWLYNILTLKRYMGYPAFLHTVPICHE